MCEPRNKSSYGYRFADIAAEAGGRLGGRSNVRGLLKRTSLPAAVRCTSSSTTAPALTAVRALIV